MSTTVADVVEQGAAGLGVRLPPDALLAFETYKEFLEKQGETVNLTAIKGSGDVARLHFLDSLALLKVAGADVASVNAASMGAASVNFANGEYATDVREAQTRCTGIENVFAGARVIDVGSGAGFPGVPLKIAEPSIRLTLLDATRKRVEFLKQLCGLLGIKADCIHARAEEYARDPEAREGFDIALSRAVARLNVLCELCLPLVRVGGLFIASKGSDSDGEIEEARGALATLGAELLSVPEYAIPGVDGIRRAVVIRKTSATPDAYPRRFARIKSKPL
jgi:16S rRNA (guanine527-N7)-methyltransferase